MDTANGSDGDLRQILDAMVDGVIHVDTEGRLVHANRAACRMIGWDPSAREFLELGLNSHLFTRDGVPLEPDEYPVNRALHGETVRQQPLIFEASDGTAAKVITSSCPLLRHGMIVGAIASFHNVTVSEAAIDELRAAARFSAALVRIGTLVGSTLEVDEIMTAAVKEMCEAVGAETAMIVMRRDGAWVTTYSYRFPSEILGVVLTDAEAPHAAMALRTGAPVAIDDAYEDAGVDHDTMRLYGIRSVVTMPLIQEGAVVGVLFLNHHTAPVKFTRAQIEFLGAAATTISLALRNADLYDAQRRVADTLQQAMLMLPEQLPDVDFSCLYHSATESVRVGGDFYDIFEMPGRRIGLAVGDVSGKGLPAAATAAMARNIVKAYALAGDTPSEVLRKVNEALRPSLDTSSFVTLLFGVLDVSSGTFTYSSGGHPPAFLRGPDAGLRALSEGGTVLGPFADSRYLEESCEIGDGDTLVLYTDGLTEARNNGALYGEQRLLRALRTAPDGCNAERLVEHLFFDVLDYAGGHLSDDLALLAVRVAPSA